MTLPKYIQRTIRLKPEVDKIFNDLEAWHNHCRFNLLPFNPADLYKSPEYKSWQREQEYLARKARRESKSAKGD
jgi:hypothetical protein